MLQDNLTMFHNSSSIQVQTKKIQGGLRPLEFRFPQLDRIRTVLTERTGIEQLLVVMALACIQKMTPFQGNKVKAAPCKGLHFI